MTKKIEESFNRFDIEWDLIEYMLITNIINTDYLIKLIIEDYRKMGME